MVKVCTKCKVDKELTEFYKQKSTKYGLFSQCKSCEKERLKKYRESNKERIKEIQKKWREDNKQHLKQWREYNEAHLKEYQKKWAKNNKEHIKEKHKKWCQTNKEHLKEYQKKYNKEYNKLRRKKDSLFKLKGNLRNRTYQAFRNKGYSKNTKTQEMLGVDWEVTKQHIEKQFKKGMSWDNYGEWHIDHIIPLASAKTPKRLKQLCHYTNLQPLWAEDNLIKSDSINGQQTLLRI